MLNPDFRDMLSALNDEGVEYLVVGAYAMAAHGVPRATGDLDFWIRPTQANARKVIRALEVFGAPVEEVPERDLTDPDVVFQVGREPNRIDFLTDVYGLEFATAWERRVDLTVDGLPISVLGREDLILNKKTVGRPRDLARRGGTSGGSGG